jgi:hypothetical protein
LVKWLGKPTSESTWIDEGELKKIDPKLYAKTAEVFLSKPCFFQPGGIDAEA